MVALLGDDQRAQGVLRDAARAAEFDQFDGLGGRPVGDSVCDFAGVGSFRLGRRLLRRLRNGFERIGFFLLRRRLLWWRRCCEVAVAAWRRRLLLGEQVEDRLRTTRQTARVRRRPGLKNVI